MVADANCQNNERISLVKIEMKPLDADVVQYHLKADNEGDVQELVQQWSLREVLHPKPKGPSRNTATSLHFAVKHGAEKSLRVLLSSGPSKEDLETPDKEGQTALLTAVDNARPGELKQLLLSGANTNARDNNRRGALHLLVKEISSNSTTPEEQRRLLEVADVLLSSPHVSKLDLEPHATLGGLTYATPLAVAAAKVKQTPTASWVPSLIELCKKLVIAGASLSEDADGTTVENVLTEKRCLTQELLLQRQQVPSRPTAAHVVDVICMGGSGNEVNNVLQRTSEEEAFEAANSRLGSDSLLLHAVDTMSTSLVEVLLNAGANPSTLEVSRELPLHRAAAKGHVVIFTKLLNKMKGDSTTLDLKEHTTSLIRNLMENSPSKVTSEDRDHMACFRLLLKDDVKINLNQKHLNQTSLQVAAAFNNQEAVKEMIQAGAFLGSRQAVLGEDYGTALNSVLPGTLEQAMDGCIKHYCTDGSNNNENLASEDYTLQLDYRFLLPPEEEDTKSNPDPVNETEVLMDICRSRRHRRVIKHPLVQTLLYTKWRKALPLYLANVAVYLFLVIVLTVFVYFLTDHRVMEAQLAKLKLNGTIDTSVKETELENHQSSVSALKVLLLSVWGFMLVREIFQLRFSQELYFKNIENYLEWFLLVVVLVLCVTPLDVHVTRHLAAWAMIVAWYEFVLVLGRAPPLSLYITMLRHVSWNFLKLIFLFGALILAFTISFNIILQPSGDDPSEDFSTFWTTLPKAIVMSTGEFEYSDLSEKFPRTELMISCVLVFLVFLFVIFLVLMNVMNALAVTDAQQVVEDAKLYSLTSRLELVYLVEIFFLNCPFLRSRLGKIQVLSGPSNAPFLRAKINQRKKNERLLSGCTHKNLNKLDGDTTECLRFHRQQHLEDEKNKQHEKSAAEIEAFVKGLVLHHPHVLDSLAAPLRPDQ